MSLLKTDKRAWKNEFFGKFLALLEEHPNFLIVNADNISSRQMQLIRINLRGKATMVMGKNTRFRKAILSQIDKNPPLEKILPFVKQSTGFVFTRTDLREVKTSIGEHSIKAPAKAGAIAPIDVFVKAQQTSMGPETTSFFQALSISTRITKGCVEILNDVHIIKKGQLIGASEAALLKMLNIQPFEYKMNVKRVFENGSSYDPFVLEITNEDIVSRVKEGVQRLAALSLGLSYPTKSSAQLFVGLAFRKMLAVAVAADVDYENANEYKAILNDPSKLASMSAAATTPAAAQPSAAPVATTAAAESEEESEDEGGMFSLFD